MSETRVKPGALLEGRVDRIDERGLGVVAGPDRVVFVPNALPGDTVRVRITHRGARQAAGEVEAILAPSPERTPPYCPHIPVCGGGDFGCAAYDAQLRWKSGFVAEALAAADAPILAPDLAPILPSPKTLRYRNKLVFHVAFAHPRVIAGLFRRHSHRTVDIDACPLQEGPIDRALPRVKRAIEDRKWPVYNEARKTGSLRRLSLRSGTDGRLLLTLVVKRPNLPGLEQQASSWLREIEGLAGVLLNVQPEEGNAVFSGDTRLVEGEDTIVSRVCGLRFRTGPTTFFQVNPSQTGRLVALLADRLEPCDGLIDAYCGAGLPGLALAQKAGRLVGIDADPRAVEAAAGNASRNRIANARFVAGDVDRVLPEVLDDLRKRECALLLDPPRRGLPEAALRCVAASSVRQILYVSCNPRSLARDLVGLCAGGFRIDGLTPLDMFPQTRHVECAAFLSR